MPFAVGGGCVCVTGLERAPSGPHGGLQWPPAVPGAQRHRYLRYREHGAKAVVGPVSASSIITGKVPVVCSKRKKGEGGRERGRDGASLSGAVYRIPMHLASESHAAHCLMVWGSGGSHGWQEGSEGGGRGDGQGVVCPRSLPCSPRSLTDAGPVGAATSAQRLPPSHHVAPPPLHRQWSLWGGLLQQLRRGHAWHFLVGRCPLPRPRASHTAKVSPLDTPVSKSEARPSCRCPSPGGGSAWRAHSLTRGRQPRQAAQTLVCRQPASLPPWTRHPQTSCHKPPIQAVPGPLPATFSDVLFLSILASPE